MDRDVQFLNRKALEKCAWFAPVSVIVSAFLVLVIGAVISGFVLPNYSNQGEYGYYTYEDKYFIILSLWNVLVFLIPIAVSVGLFFAALSSASRSDKKKTYTVCFLPAVLSILSLQLPPLFNMLLMDVVLIQPSVVAIIIPVTKIVLSIASAVGSYFLAINSFKAIDSDNNTAPVYIKAEYQQSGNLNLQQNQNVPNTQQIMYTPSESTKSKLSAGLLCFFLGEFGIHRFYVGKVGTGILWLFTGGLFGIGWFVDLLTIIFGGFKDSNGSYLS